MYQRYRHFAKFDPFAYFMLNMFAFCTVMYCYGVFLLKQDPGGSIFFVFFGVWICLGSCMAHVYRLARLDEWTVDSPHTRGELVKMKLSAVSVIDYIPKHATWADIEQLSNDLKKNFSNLNQEYARLLIICAQEKRAGNKCLCKEANNYIRAHPINWNVVLHA